MVKCYKFEMSKFLDKIQKFDINKVLNFRNKLHFEI